MSQEIYVFSWRAEALLVKGQFRKGCASSLHELKALFYGKLFDGHLAQHKYVLKSNLKACHIPIDPLEGQEKNHSAWRSTRKEGVKEYKEPGFDDCKSTALPARPGLVALKKKKTFKYC